VVWIDAHPDTGMPECGNNGYHSMAISHLTGHGDQEFVDALPATVATSRVALVGLHSWEEDQVPFTEGWGLATFSPAELAESSEPVLEWWRSTGCSKLAIHWDVDSVDSDDIVFGLGMEPDGLSRRDVARIVRDLAEVGDVVGFTVAEYIPRQVIAIRELLAGMPLISGASRP
jgi:arginase